MSVTEQKERLILFSGEMVKAILDGRKTMTRRLVKPTPEFCGGAGERGDRARWGLHSMDSDRRFTPVDKFPCQYGGPGDTLWVRETWSDTLCDDIALYKSDGIRGPVIGQKWRSPIHMPRWASRITLEVTSVKVERLQDISEEDAKAEGYFGDGLTDEGRKWMKPRDWFSHVLETINGRDAWLNNPWVWAISFRRVKP